MAGTLYFQQRPPFCAAIDFRICETEASIFISSPFVHTQPLARAGLPVAPVALAFWFPPLSPISTMSLKPFTLKLRAAYSVTLLKT